MTALLSTEGIKAFHISDPCKTNLTTWTVFSRKLLLNELLNIHLPGWGDGRGRMEKHTHVLRMALFVLLFLYPKPFKRTFWYSEVNITGRTYFNHRLLRAGA